MRISNGWAEKAAKILEREQTSVRPYRPLTGAGWCDCLCHETCHTCGRPFVGSVPHINCADTIGESKTTTWTNTWNFLGPGGYGSALTD